MQIHTYRGCWQVHSAHRLGAAVAAAAAAAAAAAGRAGGQVGGRRRVQAGVLGFGQAGGGGRRHAERLLPVQRHHHHHLGAGAGGARLESRAELAGSRSAAAIAHLARAGGSWQDMKGLFSPGHSLCVCGRDRGSARVSLCVSTLRLPVCACCCEPMLSADWSQAGSAARGLTGGKALAL
ncbi:hypothetical protein chiPu_0011425 [Chiloscyllium punctatum]|uniref:Uncharacterized protein n=1 Tax=Chiloscyllium punctatum TaxID=137246 RepID=A0A401SRE2_CHIPU|nr:hypothetical protein [Chiloscyllium punctatum]